MALFGRKPVDFVIAGLGNPGREYEKTRHNTGFMALDYISGRLNAPGFGLKHMALASRCSAFGHNVLLLKPQTYMNASGSSVATRWHITACLPPSLSSYTTISRWISAG